MKLLKLITDKLLPLHSHLSEHERILGGLQAEEDRACSNYTSGLEFVISTKSALRESSFITLIPTECFADL